MINFSFSFKPKIKERKTNIKKTKLNNPPKIKNIILDKDITGTIILLNTNSDINASYVFYVNIDNSDKIVPIDKECYSCRNRRSVYRITKTEFVVYNRFGDGILPELPLCFVPFKTGLHVLGNIIKNKDDNITFKIKKILNE